MKIHKLNEWLDSINEDNQNKFTINFNYDDNNLIKSVTILLNGIEFHTITNKYISSLTLDDIRVIKYNKKISSIIDNDLKKYMNDSIIKIIKKNI